MNLCKKCIHENVCSVPRTAPVQVVTCDNYLEKDPDMDHRDKTCSNCRYWARNANKSRFGGCLSERYHVLGVCTSDYRPMDDFRPLIPVKVYTELYHGCYDWLPK